MQSKRKGKRNVRIKFLVPTGTNGTRSPILTVHRFIKKRGLRSHLLYIAVALSTVKLESTPVVKNKHMLVPESKFILVSTCPLQVLPAQLCLFLIRGSSLLITRSVNHRLSRFTSIEAVSSFAVLSTSTHFLLRQPLQERTSYEINIMIFQFHVILHHILATRHSTYFRAHQRTYSCVATRLKKLSRMLLFYL